MTSLGNGRVVLLLVGGILLGCGDDAAGGAADAGGHAGTSTDGAIPNNPQPDGSTGGSGGQAAVDASVPGDASDLDGSVRDAGDASDASDAQCDNGALRFCSASVTQPVSWGYAWESHCNPTPLTQGCPLRWGCGTFSVAKANAALCNGGPGHGGEVTGRAFGFLVIQEWFGLSVIRGYYDEATGALIGYWEQDDVGLEACSGSVPRDYSDSNSVTDIEQLCTPDGGAWPSDGGDAG